MSRTIAPRYVGGVVALLALFAGAPSAEAHGERNQEPFLRMRTVHFFDVQWSTQNLNVNEPLVITGRFRLFKEWPVNLPEPDVVFLGNGTPGPVLVRTESYINGVPMIQSTRLVRDRDYEFKTVLRGRIPGRHHVHPMLNVENAGPLVGPGTWITIGGSHGDFTLPATAISGEQIPNLETWGLTNVFGWHGTWLLMGGLWILWWVRRPLFLTRYAAVEAGKYKELVTRADRWVGAGFLVVTLALVIGGFQWAESKYPRTIPLQGGRAEVEPLPLDTRAVKVRLDRATYDVPGRSMRLALTLTNFATRPVRVGEFATANLRFVNRGVPAAVAGITADYPAELVARTGLKLSDSRPLAPGETRALQLEATDVAWETERLTSLLNDPDNKVGGLLFLFDTDGHRIIANVYGPILPVYTN